LRGDGVGAGWTQWLTRYLRRVPPLAAARLAQERPGQILQATALVHEAWLRLAGAKDQHWQNARRLFCINQLKQIEVTKQTWTEGKDKPEDAVPTVADLADYLEGGKLPKCRDSGSYVIGKLNQNPSCSVAGHELPKRPN